MGVLGAGKSGLAAAALLKKLGAQVFLSESTSIKHKIPLGVEHEVGRHSHRLLACDLLIPSPGVPLHLPILKQARRRGIPIWSELELASRCIDPRQLIAITGTNGKTTTTTLAGELFKSHDRDTIVAGNIGTPLSACVGKVGARAVVVLETSSYQLEAIRAFHPTISAILNVTPDHVDHHGSLGAYVAAKARIFENQTSRDTCVLNADDPWCRRLAKRCRAQVLFFSRRRRLPKGVFFKKGEITVRWRDRNAHWPLSWVLPGPHNVENALAAIAVSLAGGVPLSKMKSVLARFRGVEHRLEQVRILNGVSYVNDSKATNVDSTRVALESFTRPLIVIMGGRGKGIPYTSLKERIKAQVRHLLLIGEDAAQIAKDLGPVVSYEKVGTMTHAVARAQKFSQLGDIVLLSPACASFDQYQNYEERGRHFKELVRKLR